MATRPSWSRFAQGKDDDDPPPHVIRSPHDAVHIKKPLEFTRGPAAAERAGPGRTTRAKFTSGQRQMGSRLFFFFFFCDQIRRMRSLPGIGGTQSLTWGGSPDSSPHRQRFAHPAQPPGVGDGKRTRPCLTSQVQTGRPIPLPSLDGGPRQRHTSRRIRARSSSAQAPAGICSTARLRFTSLGAGTDAEKVRRIVWGCCWANQLPSR